MANEDNTTTTTSENKNGAEEIVLFGRKDIFTSVEEITEENVIAEVNSALVYHLQNVQDEDYLYWYRRGFQPILSRKKERNTVVNNKVVENNAASVVNFKNGYFLQEPCFYVSRKSGKKRKVDKLNEYLYQSGKQEADNIIADWFHTVGKAALFVEANKDVSDVEAPIKAYAVDPRSAFVVYSMRAGNAPVFGVNIVISGYKALIDVYTDDMVYRLIGSSSNQKTTWMKNFSTVSFAIDKVEKNWLGHIPIIEYRYNSVNTGSFEEAISLLDSLNKIRSNQVDGIEQFIQSIAVAVNCQFEEGTSANQIKEQGMILLSSIGENKAEFKILSEELNQQQTETLVNSIYNQVLRICAMPSASMAGHGTYDATGAAAIFNNGWEQAAASARNTEDLFRQSNRHFDAILVDVLKKRELLDIATTDFELNFVRNETSNIQSKAQAAQTMLAMGMHPELAFKKSGLSNDPVSDMKLSEKYLKMIWGDPDKVDKAEEKVTENPTEDQFANGVGEAEIVEEDNANGEDEVG